MFNLKFLSVNINTFKWNSWLIVSLNIFPKVCLQNSLIPLHCGAPLWSLEFSAQEPCLLSPQKLEHGESCYNLMEEINFLCYYFLWISVWIYFWLFYLCIMCMPGACRGQKRGSDPLEGVTYNNELCGERNLSLDLPDEQAVLLIIEKFLQLQELIVHSEKQFLGFPDPKAAGWDTLNSWRESCKLSFCLERHMTF